MIVLPDVLAADLDIVFCGTAAGRASAKKRAYYAGPGNAFWPTLFAVGLTPWLVRPQDYVELTRWKLGITDLAKHASGSDRILEKGHFDPQRLRELILQFRPRCVAFTGKRAAMEFTEGSVAYGLLSEAIGSTRLFVLPSPSGAARRYWDEDYWHQLARLRASSGCAGRVTPTPSSIATPNSAPDNQELEEGHFEALPAE
jgi:TDG/mug DNA glycosylase family protein